MKLWRVRVTVPHQVAETTVASLEDHMDTVSWFECDIMSNEIDTNGFPIAEEFIVEGLSKTIPNQAQLEAELAVISTLLGVSPFPIILDQIDGGADWLTASWHNFPPRTIGRYYVYSGYTESTVPTGLNGIKITAATAFGSGEHETTKGCLLSLSKLSKMRTIQNPLDMGCGSGILAIAIAKTWNCSVIAADNDGESVRVTIQNSILNNCQKYIQAFKSHGFNSEKVKSSGPFDLIVANILARPLCQIAVDAAEALRPNGIIILSGLLERQVQQVLRVYHMQKLHLVQKTVINNWATLTLKK